MAVDRILLGLVFMISLFSRWFKCLVILRRTTSPLLIPFNDSKYLFSRLLELGFDQFVRVGSVKKIAKPVLPFSIHSIGTESQELKELQALLRTELTSSEKA